MSGKSKFIGQKVICQRVLEGERVGGWREGGRKEEREGLLRGVVF